MGSRQYVMEVEGVYREESNEGVDTYLSVMGIPWIARKVAAMANPTIEIKRSGEDWSLYYKTKFLSNNVNFKIGQQFEEKNPAGKVVKVLATYEDNRLVLVSQTEKGEV